MTVTGTTLGSVHYFSPEQARGDEVTGASDVYALGIVLFEMLTGRRPFEADNAAAVALRRLNEDPPTPSSLGHQLPPGLEAIVMRAMAREPSDRFPDAGALAEALRVWRRNPDAAPAAGAAVAGAAVAGAAAAGAAATPPGGEPTVYVPPRVTSPADRQSVGTAAPYDDDHDGGGTPWWTWVLAILGVILLGIIGFLFVQLLGGPPASSASPSPSVAQVAVPECENETISTVRSRLDAAGLTIREEDQSSDEVDEGRVIRCEPSSGTEVDEDSEVLVYVSIGAEAVAVPRLSGQTQAEATETLRDAGLAVGDITQEDHPDIPAGSVIRTNPAAGVEVEEGEQIDLVISRGPSPSPTPSPTPVPTPTPTPVPTPTPTLPPTPEPSA